MAASILLVVQRAQHESEEEERVALTSGMTVHTELDPIATSKSKAALEKAVSAHGAALAKVVEKSKLEQESVLMQLAALQFQAEAERAERKSGGLAAEAKVVRGTEQGEKVKWCGRRPTTLCRSHAKQGCKHEGINGGSGGAVCGGSSQTAATAVKIVVLRAASREPG